MIKDTIDAFKTAFIHDRKWLVLQSLGFTISCVLTIGCVIDDRLLITSLIFNALYYGQLLRYI